MNLLSELQRDGIALTTAETLFGSVLWQDLQDAAAARVTASRVELTLRREGRLRSLSPSHRVVKTYLVKLLGERPIYEPGSVWARVVEDPALLDLATQYLAYPAPELKAFNLWYTLPSAQAPSDSQLWHQDKDDYSILKAFVYLTDVTLEAGPLTYIAGTHAGHTSWHPRMFLDYARVPRATDEAMAEVVPACDWRIAIGPVGTVVLVDTTGWHKGGYGTVDRCMFTALYTTKPPSFGQTFTR